MRSRSEQYIGRLHVLTDETVQDRFSHLELAKLAARAGADTIQFREKRPRSTRELVAIAGAIVEAVRPLGGRVIVNDRVDVAAAVAADGVHLGRDDLDPLSARRVLGPEALIGVTANGLDEARALADAPVDYVGVGPVFGTRSKAAPAPALGLECLKEIVTLLRLPIVAIGNVTAARTRAVLEAGAHGVAVLSAVARHENPEQAVAELLERMDGVFEDVARE